MRAPATVSIDDDLAASKASISVQAANDKLARWVEVVNGVVVEVLCGDDLVDHVLLEVGLDLLLADIRAVLRGNDNGVDANGDHGAVVVLVLHSDLGLSVRADPKEGCRPS